MRTCIRLSLLALLAIAGLALPRAARAAPDAEKLTLDGKGTGTNGPIAAVVHESAELLVVANYSSDTVSIFEMPSVSAVFDGDDEVTLDVGDGPIAVAVWESGANYYAFVANNGDDTISVIDLDSVPPVVLTDREIDLSPDADIPSPGPVALAVSGDSLFVATNDPGSVMRYDLSVLPGVTPTHDAFPTAAPDQTTTGGNLVVCQNTDTPNGTAWPRALLVYGGFLWAACSSGGVAQFSSNGSVVLRGDIDGGLTSAEALAGDPRGNPAILYILSDDHDGVFAINLADDHFLDEGDPVFEDICASGGALRNYIPITESLNASAMIAYTDLSDSAHYLLVLTTGSSVSYLQVTRIDEIDPEVAEAPECGLETEGSITARVTLELGNPVFPDGAAPGGTGQQISNYGDYIALPNFGASSGANMVSLVTDAPLLMQAGSGILAIGYDDPMVVDEEPLKTEAALAFESDEVLVDTLAMDIARVRLKGELGGSMFTPEGYNFTEPNVTVRVGSDEVASTLGLGPSDNETLEVLLALEDENSNIGYVAREVIYDTTKPVIKQPENPMDLKAGVQVGSNELTVTVAGASDVEANGVQSGLGGFYVVFTSAIGEDMTPLATLPEPMDIASTSTTFNISPLTNNVTYTFDIRALDLAGNQSDEVVMNVSGTPLPGITLLELTGETGCVLARGARGLNAAELLLWIGALALAVRRRGARA